MENQSNKVVVRRRFPVTFKLHCVRQFKLTNIMRSTARDNGINRSTLRNWDRYKRVLRGQKRRTKKYVFFLTQVSK